MDKRTYNRLKSRADNLRHEIEEDTIGTWESDTLASLTNYFEQFAKKHNVNIEDVCLDIKPVDRGYSEYYHGFLVCSKPYTEDEKETWINKEYELEQKQKKEKEAAEIKLLKQLSKKYIK